MRQRLRAQRDTCALFDSAHFAANLEDLVERMTEQLGARVEIKHGPKGVGKLIINYDSLDQLEGVLQRLG